MANLNLLDLNDLGNGYLKTNDIFFINWQKVVSKSKDNRKLRMSGEQNISFDDFIAETHAHGREIVVIVDEAHIAKNTELSQEIIDLLNPKIEIHVTATPKYIPNIEETGNHQAGYVSVNRKAVIEEGLIKESIEIMPLEEIEKVEKLKGYEDQDSLLLDLAFDKKNELRDLYQSQGININPLVLIQLPNDDKEKDATKENKMEIVKFYLKNKGIEPEKVAVWLSDEKENLDEITRHDSEIDFLIFKQAAATGWDCPRAQILVMFREVNTPVFRTQVIGRVLRMPEAKHYAISELNKAYLYTNYESNQIELPDNKDGQNKPKLLKSYRKLDPDMNLPSVFLKRAKYGDLGDSFQKTFIETANQYFGLKGDEIFDQTEKALNAKGLETQNAKLTNELIINASIDSYDDFQEQLAKAEDTLSYHASRHDIEKMYTLLLYRELAVQEENNKKFAPERSWSKLKTAINIWLKDNSVTNPPLYEIIAFDLLKKENSVMRRVIAKALENYKPIREQEEEIQVEKSREAREFKIFDAYSFNDDHEIKATKKCILEPFFIRKNYDGRKNEEAFIDYLEQSQIDWWFKNGDYGRDFLSIEYTDKNGKQNLFYPDFIIRTSDGRTGIMDTKKGRTAEDSKEKAEALQRYIAEQNQIGQKLFGGIVIHHGGLWRINSNAVYAYDEGDLVGWEEVCF